LEELARRELPDVLDRDRAEQVEARTLCLQLRDHLLGRLERGVLDLGPELVGEPVAVLLPDVVRVSEDAQRPRLDVEPVLDRWVVVGDRQRDRFVGAGELQRRR
jgi:hypothetical protein